MSDEDGEVAVDSVQNLFRLGIAAGLCTLLLYFVAPEDSGMEMPNPFVSRYMWTAAIPFLIGISICCMVLAGFLEELSRRQTAIAGLMIFFVILLSPQLAEFSPIESDGWWFLQIGMRFSEFGNDGTQGYLAHMLVLLPLDLISRVFPGREPLIASILGIGMFSGWLLICVRAILSEQVSRRFTLPIFTLFPLLMISWWSPSPYSAQMLALFMMAVLLYTNPGREIPSWLYFSTALLVPLAHIQISIVICLTMLVDSALSVTRSRVSLLCGYLLGISFFSWNFTGGKVPFMNQFPEQTPFPISFVFFVTLMSIAFILSAFVNARLTRDKESGTFQFLTKIDHMLGISNFSLLVGCILLMPLVALVDFRINAARLTPRLIVYCMVPFIMWSSKAVEHVFQKLERGNLTKEGFKTVIVICSILCGSLASIGHVNYVGRTILIPHESVDCWDMTEERGIRGLMPDRNFRGEANFIIHSPMFLSPADEYYFWYFYHLGDETKLPNKSPDTFSAVLETADMSYDDWVNLGLDPNTFENWTLVGEVPGACRFWVNPADVVFLDETAYWDRR